MTKQADREDAVAAVASPILVTKLYRTPVPSGAVPRAALLDRLELNRHRPLTLVSAPAGYGKSTLVSMWLEATASPGVWISLDENDNGLHAVLSYLVAGITSVFPDSLPTVRTLLEAPRLPESATLGSHLLNEIETIGAPFILVLDDFHKVHEQAIFDFLTFLLRHPSRYMHLVVISRRDPPLQIPALRAQRQVTEIRLRDLRFVTPETAHLLSKLLERPVTEEVAAEWTARTEGWVTALQLAALSLRERSHSDAPLTEAIGTNQFIEEYLLAEVLAQLPQVTLERLLSVSILDRFCAPLCDAVCPPTEFSDGDGILTGEAFIGWLRRANWFLIPLDSNSHWFRLHHLIRQRLRERLQTSAQPDEVSGLLRRACAWFSEHELPDEAIRYAVAAEDWPAAEHLIVQYHHELMNTEQWNRLQEWLKQLPPEILEQSIFLVGISAYLALTAAQSMRALDQLTTLTKTLGSDLQDNKATRSILGEVAAIESVQYLMHGQADSARFSAQRALDLLLRAPSYPRSVATAVYAMTLQMQGEYEAGVKMMNSALSELEWPLRLRADMYNHLCILTFVEGDLNAVIQAARAGLRLTMNAPMLRSKCVAHYYLGAAHYLRNELKEAELHLRIVEQNRDLTPASHLVFSLVALALIHVSRGEWDQAVEIAEGICEQFATEQDLAAKHIAEAFRVELAFRRGELVEARRLAAGVEFDNRPPLWFFYLPNLTPIKLLFAGGAPNDLANARVALEALDEAMRLIHRKPAQIEIMALLALVCDAQRDQQAAYAALTEALFLGQSGGYVRTFVDYGRPMIKLLQELTRANEDLPSAARIFLDRILDAAQLADASGSVKLASGAGPAQSSALHALDAPLTRREQQILRRLTTDHSPVEIADDLAVSVSTVRSHVKSIYRKLDVHSRFEAVDSARRLGLV